MAPVIGHIDLDYFYAQVEEVLDPSIKSRPVVVCVFSGRTEDSGVVSTANYRARELGVGSGMPIALAKKKLAASDPVMIKMEREKYEAPSARIMRIVEERVDVLEQTGIDEAFFDVTSSTGGDYGAARRVAEDIKVSILSTEKLTCSMGIGRSKVVAKLGSDMAKPGGIKVVEPDSTEAFLSPLAVTKLYGVGPKTADALQEFNIATAGDLARADRSKLEDRLGKKLAGYLSAASRGMDDDPVRAGLEPTQYSRIITLPKDMRDPKEAVLQLAAGIDYLQTKLSGSNRSFRTLTAIGILTDLSTHTRSRTFDVPIRDAAVIRAGAQELFAELSSAVPREFRRVGIRVSGLVDDEDQRSLSEFIQQAGQ